MKNTVLFVCTGNTCRSPMCAALFNAKYSTNTSLYAVSAGLYSDGTPISKNAVIALSDYGIVSSSDNNYEHHVSHTVTEDDIASASFVYGVTASHVLQLKMMFPAYSDKIYPLPRYISDPFGGNIEAYKSCLCDIDNALSELYPTSENKNSSVVTITEASDSLIEDILAIENEAFSCPWSKRSFQEAFESDNITIYVAQNEEGQLCGFACIMAIDFEAELLNIAVSKRFRRMGIGDALLQHSLDEVKNKNVTDVFLEVRMSNIAAQELYNKHGFEALGIRKKYYSDPTEDAVIMKKVLNNNSIKEK